MKRSRQILIALSGATLLGAVTLLLVVTTALPWVVERALIATLGEHCQSCVLSVEGLELSLSAPQIALRRPRLTQGWTESTAVRAAADHIAVSIALRDLMRGHIHIRDLSIHEPHVLVIEGDAMVPRSLASARGSVGFWKSLSIDRTEVNRGEFVYRRFHAGQSAGLTWRNVSVRVGPWGTTHELAKKKTRAIAESQLGGAGRFSVELESVILSAEPNVDVTTSIVRQDLADVRSFFSTHDGIEISGRILDGKGRMQVRGASLVGRVTVTYQDLVVRFRRTPDRSAIATLLANVGQSAKLIKSNVRASEGSRSEPVAIHRLKSETLLQYVLRGYKVGALGLIMH